MSAITGLGTSRDKLARTSFELTATLPDEHLEALYDGDDMAARIVESIPDDALRQGFEIQIDAEDDNDAAQIEETKETSMMVMSALDELHAVPRLNEAWTWGRLFGGAALWVLVDDGRAPDKPLVPERVRRVTSLLTMDKRSLVPHSLFLDHKDPNFGEVELYQVSRSDNLAQADDELPLFIHSSRLIVFEGARTTRRRKRENDGWGHSVLQRPCEVLKQFNVSFQAVSHRMVDSSQGVFKLKGLMDWLGSEDTKTLTQRMEMVDISRSVARSVLLDAEGEDFQYIQNTFTGTSEVLDKLMLRLAAAARMPVTKLMGQSPAGMNATGESDLVLWESEVVAHQEQVLKPRLRRLIELLMLSSEGPTGGKEPENWFIEFKPLRQMTEAETADNRLKVAQADAIYLTNGVTLPEEVALSRFRASGFSMETDVDLELRKEVLEAEAEKLAEQAGEPDPAPPSVPLPPGQEPPPEQEPEDGPDAS